MRDYEKALCDDILRYGTIVSDKEFKCDNDMVRQYEIECDGERYLMTKVNGEWDYFHRTLQ